MASPLEKTAPAQRYLASSVQNKTPAIFFPQEANELSTPGSISAYLSQHWQLNEVALEHSSEPEIIRNALELGYRKKRIGCFTYYIYAP